MKLNFKRQLTSILGLMLLISLFLAGCANKQHPESTMGSNETKTTAKVVELSNKELAVSAYLENYIDQFGTKDIPAAIKQNLKKSELSILSTDKNKYQIQEAKELSNGLMASEVTFTDNHISSRNFNGNQLKETKQYTKKQLDKKYGPYQKEVDKLIKKTKTAEDQAEKLDYEEMAMAAYVINSENGLSFEEALNLLSEYVDTGTFESNPLKIHIGGAADTGTFEILQGQVVCDFMNGGSPETREYKYSVKELNDKYKEYKSQLDDLIRKAKSATEEEHSDSTDDEDADTEDDEDTDDIDVEDTSVEVPHEVMDITKANRNYMIEEQV
jgi:PBP1b-binding outer membrane lipoprotein LpoB